MLDKRFWQKSSRTLYSFFLSSVVACYALLLSTDLEAKIKTAVYEVDPVKSIFQARTTTAGILSAFAHNHIIEAAKSKEGVKGEIFFTGPDMTSLWMEVNSQSLIVKDEELDKADREKVKASLNSKELLNPEAFPKIGFRSDKINSTVNRFQVHGNFELVGKSKQVAFPMTIQFKKVGKYLVGKGRFNIKQTDFGIEPFSKALGAIAVADSVEIAFQIFAIRKQ